MATEGNMFSTEGSSMEQVRELLFGAQFKEMEIRLQRQHERFQQEVADARDEWRKRVDSLEKFMKSEVSSLLTRVNAEKAERDSALKDCRRDFDASIKNEQRERGEALAQMAKDMKAMESVFERKMSALSDSLDTTERELRELLLNESNSLSGKNEERYQQALEQIKKTAEQIRHDMVHRTAFSGMLTELAVKISGQWSPEIVRPSDTPATPEHSDKKVKVAANAAQQA